MSAATTACLCGPADREEWNEFAAWCPGSDVLQSFEWGELKAMGEWRPLRLAIRERARITAGLAMLERALPLRGRTILYAPRGPLIRDWTPERLHDLVQAARGVARERGAILLKVDPAVCEPEKAALLRSEGFVPVGGQDGFGGTQPRCVMTLGIGRSDEEILAEFKPKWRYNIRLAERRGVTVRADCSREDLRVFYDLLKTTADRDRFLVRSFEYFEAMWDRLVPAGMGRLFLATLDGGALSGAFCTTFGPTCCYTYGASSNEHRDAMPNYLMQWTMIRWARDHGYRTYDFRGVSPRHVDPEHDRLAGLNRFKAGFGAEFVEYVGEFDLPVSRLWYPVWVRALPRARRLLKRRAAGEAASVGRTDDP